MPHCSDKQREALRHAQHYNQYLKNGLELMGISFLICFPHQSSPWV